MTIEMSWLEEEIESSPIDALYSATDSFNLKSTYYTLLTLLI